MEFAAVPLQPTKPVERVALVCELYDNGDFLTYPCRAGDRWKHVLQEEGQATFHWYEINNPTDDRLLESFYQTWFFFGLLHEVLSPVGLYHEEEYIQEDTAGKYLYGGTIPDRLRQWKTAVLALQPEQILQRQSRLIQCLNLMYQSCRPLIPTQQVGSGHPGFDRALKDCIICLAAMVVAAAEQTFEIPTSATWSSFEIYASFTDEEKQRMQSNGWCPSVVAMEDKSFSSVNYRHYIKRLRIPETGIDHGMCSELSCSFEAIDATAFRGCHVTSDCQCAMVGAPQDVIEQCLIDGTYPVMSVSGDLDRLTIEIVPYGEDISYVALSHVWADGLGNPTGNKLPRCQLLRVQRYVTALETRPNLWTDEVLERARKLYWWCDTLLVPVQKAANSSRKSVEETTAVGQRPDVTRSIHMWTLAMAKMKDTYEKASFVLVLDKSLEAVSTEEVGLLEANVRLHSSRWTRRLWTLQESTLAARVVVQYRDGPVPLRDLDRHCRAFRNQDPVLRDLCSTITGRNVNLRGTKALPMLDGPNLLSLYMAVRERGCSHAEDEPLCCGTIMNIDLAGMIASQDRTERLRQFWLAMVGSEHGIPDNVIWSQFPRMDLPGYRWAVSTFKQDLSFSNRHLINPQTAKRAELLPGVGLRVKSAGYRLRVGLGSLGMITRLHVSLYDSIKQGLLHILLPNDQWATLLPVKTGDAKESRPWNLLEKQLDDAWYLVKSQDGVFASQDSHYALLGRLQQHVTGEQVLRSQMLVMIKPLDSSWNTMMRAAAGHARDLRTSEQLRTVQWMTLLDLALGQLINILPTFISSRIKPFLAKCIGAVLNFCIGRFWINLADIAKLDKQTPVVQKALTEIGGPRPEGFSMTAHISMNFTGHGAVVEEEFPPDHEWIVD